MVMIINKKEEEEGEEEGANFDAFFGSFFIINDDGIDVSPERHCNRQFISITWYTAKIN